MTPEMAKAAMQFLLRTDLKGQEVAAWSQVMMALKELAEPRADKPPTQIRTVKE